jgi:UDP-N-acetylmuramoylalanine--D-glutamate ligase
MKTKEFENKNILVMGLGSFGGGLDCAKFAAALGRRVVVTDMAKQEKLKKAVDELNNLSNIELRLGEHRREDFIDADIVIANPAVRPDNEFLTLARENGAVITSQIAVFFDNCPAPIVAITGSNGKSTTTKLTWHLLDYASKNGGAAFGKVWLGGNIGNMPLLTELDSIKENDLAVLEISSFQAEQLAEEKLAPRVSVITNLTPNHLDRHGTFDQYCLAKENLFSYQKSLDSPPAVSIFNGEDPLTESWFDKYSAENNRICLKFSADQVPQSVKQNFALPGEFNLSNLAAAMAVSSVFDIDIDCVGRAVKSFRGLPHRLELVAQSRGVRWFNDSIATTPPSTIAGLQAFDGNVILIAGGYDKKLPFDEMGQAVAAGAKAAVLIGATADKIAEAIEACPGRCVVYREETFADAVNRAAKLSEAGDVVLLSPACASYDMFDNFKQRGEIFTDMARRICQKDADL